MALKFYSKLLLISGIALVSLSACRFGNYSEPMTDRNPGTSPYESVELFRTEAKELTTHVVYNDDTDTTSDVASVAWIPNAAREIFTDPFYLAVPKDPNYLALLVGSDGYTKTYTRIINATQFNNTSQEDDGDYSTITPLWRNRSNCQTQTQRFNEGVFDRSQPGSIVSGDSTLPIAGRASVEFTVMQVIAGNCANDLSEMAQCYQGTLECTPDELRTVTNFFDLYTRHSHALNLEDVTRISILAYSVRFE